MYMARRYAGASFTHHLSVSSICIGFVFAGLIALVTNTEDGQHEGPVDNIELAACLLIVAFGAQCCRLTITIVDWSSKATYDFNTLNAVL